MADNNVRSAITDLVIVTAILLVLFLATVQDMTLEIKLGSSDELVETYSPCD